MANVAHKNQNHNNMTQEVEKYRTQIRQDFHNKRGSVEDFALHKGLSTEAIRQVMSGEREDYDLLLEAMQWIKHYRPRREVRREQEQNRFVQVASQHYATV